MLQRQLLRCLPTLHYTLPACSSVEALRSREPRWHAQPFSEAAAAEAGTSDQPGQHSDPRTDRWFKDPSIGALEAAKILRTRLERFGPQRVVHLLELVRRVRTPEEAAAAIGAAQKFALHRARRAQHSALSPELSSWLLRRVAEAGDIRQALELLRRSPELALEFHSGAFATIMARASKAGDLRTVINALELLKATGLRPNRNIAFHVVRACFDNGRPDLAVAYCKEFEANGLPPRPIIRKEVEAVEQSGAPALAGGTPDAPKEASTEGEEPSGEEDASKGADKAVPEVPPVGSPGVSQPSGLL